MKVLLIAILAISSINMAFSQSDTTVIDRWLEEVYKECPTHKEVYKLDFSNIISNRFYVFNDPEMRADVITANLSDFSLKDKCNLAMQRDFEVGPDGINPFKYFFNFYSTEHQVIKVADSHFYILIYGL